MKDFIRKLYEKYPTLMEIFRFLVVGGVATVVDMLVMALVQYLLEPELYTDILSIFTAEGTGYVYVLGTACGFTVGLLVNYFLSVLFVFNHKGKSKSTYGFIVFTALSLVGLGLHVLGMYLGNTLWQINAWAVKIVMTVIVLVYNYLSKRLILFKDGKETEKSLSEEENKDD